ncbi:MAG: inorganic diphosphatase [archaeon]
MSYSKKFLNKTVKVTMDRQMGTRHEKYNSIFYTLNYGFIEGTMAPDGEELDAYVLGVFEPVKEFTGKCIAVIQRSDDNDDKLIVVPEGKEYTDEQILALTEFQERFFKPKVVRK